MGVYFDDLDPFHVLHNARYLLLFERTLGSLWEEMGFGSLQGSAEAMHLVRANTIAYHRPIQGTGKVRVRVWIERLGRTSLTFGFSVMPIDEDVEAATGERVVVHVEHGTWQPRPWNEDFRSKVAPWVVAQALGEVS
ncbi:MAG: acyl-CoA thioesterase [Deltaproteobacteria bacterium]|nr:MAG: acyl-CoA thioesterase [Deltaproteobacteria bacterium]